ncbi:unnamed protein product [Polarella glacialis]|uniref:Protein kinase domain-containing protein n=1 Tax=Polarella glacialis TaxID=89957 RepID=A0A813L249_POLGL|nr:unnamed protein product [Polarella glacialis]
MLAAHGRKLVAALMRGPPGEWLTKSCLTPWNVTIASLGAATLIVVPLSEQDFNDGIGGICGIIGLCVILLALVVIVCLEGKWPCWWLKDVSCVSLALGMNVLAASCSAESTDRLRHLARMSLAYKLWPLIGFRAELAYGFLCLSWLVDCGAHRLAAAEFEDVWDVQTPFWLLLQMMIFAYVTSLALQNYKHYYDAQTELVDERHLSEDFGQSVCDFVLRVAEDGTVLSCNEKFQQLMIHATVVGTKLEDYLAPGKKDAGKLKLKHALDSESEEVCRNVSLSLGMWGKQEKLLVDVFMVKRKARLADIRWNSLPQKGGSYLVGMRYKPSTSSMVKGVTMEDEPAAPGSFVPSIPSFDSGSAAPVCAMTSSHAFACVDDQRRPLMELGHKEHWIIRARDLVCDNAVILGSGGFGTVYEGTYHGCKVAVKVPKAEKRTHHPLLNELRVLRHVRHPNIVLFFGACIGKKASDMMLVFELIEGVTLQEFMTNPALPDNKCQGTFVKGRLSILGGIACALQYLHSVSKPIVHGDLKDSNVFVEIWKDHHRSKLGDFGLSRMVYKVTSRMGGSLRWMAPEIITSNGSASPDATADVFSFGRLMSLILSGVKPCAGLSRQDITKATRNGRLPELVWPKDSLDISKLSAFGKRCVSIDPLQRPTMMEGTEHIAYCAECIMNKTFSSSTVGQAPQSIGSGASLSLEAEVDRSSEESKDNSDREASAIHSEERNVEMVNSVF